MIPWSACSEFGFEQACAVPVRRRGTRLEVCLITSSSGRWVFPKGFIDPGETNSEAALKEAFEEAGVHGQVLGEPLGSYKARKNKLRKCLSVVVLLMQVTRSDSEWTESHRRQRRWVSVTAARQLLSQPELRDCLDAALERWKSG